FRGDILTFPEIGRLFHRNSAVSGFSCVSWLKKSTAGILPAKHARTISPTSLHSVRKTQSQSKSRLILRQD
ncbi:MAG: hypothetical protein ACLFQ6_10810, partial [Candidatus Sumerlaeia bacterium]